MKISFFHTFFILFLTISGLSASVFTDISSEINLDDETTFYTGVTYRDVLMYAFNVDLLRSKSRLYDNAELQNEVLFFVERFADKNSGHDTYIEAFKRNEFMDLLRSTRKAVTGYEMFDTSREGERYYPKMLFGLVFAIAVEHIIGTNSRAAKEPTDQATEV